MVFKYITNAVCIVSAIVSFSANAVDKNWITADNTCNDSTWDNLVCWSPTGQPLDGDDVFLSQADTVDRTVTYSNAINPVPKLDSLTINAAGTGTMTFSHTQGDLIDGFSHIGTDGVGVYNQSGGRHISQGMLLGTKDNGNGTYNLTGGSLLTDVSQIGHSGSGVGNFYQHDGSTHQTSTALEIHKNSTYNLIGGNLDNANSAVTVLGTFDQSGGNHTSETPFFGLSVSGSGVYNLTGGTLEYASTVVGNAATFNQTNGSSHYNTFSNEDGGLTVEGTYNLSNGTLESNRMIINDGGALNLSGGTFTIDGITHIGTDGVGAYNQSNGSHIANGIKLGSEDNGEGTYNLTGGSLSTDVSEIGSSGTGTGIFNQHDGSTHSTSTALDISKNGTYNLFGGTLDNTNSAVNVKGTFNQSGGTNFGETPFFGLTVLDGGAYILSGGTLEYGRMVVSSGGMFNFNGGTLAVENFTGNLINNGGTLSPGKSPGKTTVNGDYTQLGNGVFEVEIGGLAQGTEYDWLDITGNATLDGTLDVSLFDLGSGPFTLGEGDVFDILSAESIIGEFDVLSLVTLDDGLEWDISYLTDVSGTTDLVRLTVNNINEIPTADAGPDQIVNESDAVNLDGTDSEDIEDGRIVAYAWSQIAGEPIMLSGASTATPSFAAPETTSTTTLTFSLIVTDSGGAMSIADTVNIEVLNINGLPIANAGVDQIVNEDAIVNLDGQASSDSDGDIDIYSWVQTAGSSVVLSDVTAAIPTFTAPSVVSNTVLVFSLEVTDADGDTDTDTVKITVSNTLVADAGVDQQVTTGDEVQLNALNSLGVSEISSYQWTQIEGSTVNLNNSSNGITSFNAPSTGDTTLLVFKLIVTDSNGSQDSDTVFINVRDELLTDISPPLDIQLLSTVTEGNMLYVFDTESDPFINSTDIRWHQTGGPAVILNGPDTEVPSFNAPSVSADSVATFEVRSEDINGVITRANVNINILGTGSANKQPIANTGSDQTVDEGVTVILDATGSMDSDSSITGYYWQQTGGPMVLLNSLTQAQPSFVAPSIAAVDDGIRINFELIVTDNDGFVDHQPVTITVLDNRITAFSDEVTAIISTTGKPIGIEPIDDGSLVALDAIDPSTIDDDVNRPDSLPYGMLDFSLRVEPGATVKVNIALSSPADSNFTWWKYSTVNGWQEYSGNTTINAARDVITITLTDNGEGDDDPTPGVIRDPGGLALASASTTGGGSSGSGGGGSIGPYLLMILLMSLYARAYTRLKYLNKSAARYLSK